MCHLGVYHNSAGRGGVRTRLRNQMNRLFGCSVTLTYEGEQVKASMNAPIARRQATDWMCSSWCIMLQSL